MIDHENRIGRIYEPKRPRTVEAEEVRRDTLPHGNSSCVAVT